MIKSKKIISIAAAAVLGLSTLALAGCGSKEYKGEKLEGYDSAATVSSNGGFVVEKGDYVYFINGKEESTVDNTYGKVVKGALMRISKADLAAGKGEEAKIVLPSLLVSGNYDSGIYIYGDYVYYATPTTDKNNDGSIANASLDFKRAKLDGSEAPMDGKNNYFFRLASNSVKYRFVEEEGNVYCLYEENSQLKSYSVATGKTTVLVSGASGFYYDKQDLSSPVVYYTMSVSQDLDKTTPTSQPYNQIFSVSAGNTVEVDSAKAAYKAKNAKGDVVAEYDFDEKFMKDNAKDKGYDLGDYTTYPYVNLGQLVLDGIGSQIDAFPSHVVMTNEQKAFKAQAGEPMGYTYTLRAQENGGLYFTRASVVKNDSVDAKLCYIPTARANWNAITSNGSAATVAANTEKASDTALYEIDNGVHSYIYLDGSILKKATTDANGNVTSEISLTHDASSVTLWKTAGDYLYYYGAGTNGKNVARINYKGAQEDYGFLGDKEYDPVTLPLVDWSDSWYKPETVTVDGETILLYPNAQSFGSDSVAYNYIYATKLGANEQITENAEKIEEINEYIDGFTNAALKSLMKCYFRNGNGATYDADEGVRALYSEKQVKEYDAFKAEFGEGKKFAGALESDFIYLVGRMNKTDKEAVETSWANYLLTETADDADEDGLETWAIVLIVCGGALVVAAAVLIPVIVCAKRKKARKAKEEAIVSAYKRKKIDTTDDKSIDVYADEEPVETVEETVEAPVEEGTQEATEEVAEAPVEAPVEE